VATLEGERDAVLYYLLARHPGRALVSPSHACMAHCASSAIGMFCIRLFLRAASGEGGRVVVVVVVVVRCLPARHPGRTLVSHAPPVALAEVSSPLVFLGCVRVCYTTCWPDTLTEHWPVTATPVAVGYYAEVDSRVWSTQSNACCLRQ
jgi:hypothetical protein